MPKRTASAKWNGTLKEGNGVMKMGSGAYEGAYSFSTRFEEEPGTNPEELIGAAHAGCFSMALSADLERAGHNPKSVSTTAEVHLTKGDSGFSVSKIDLTCNAEVPGISTEEFTEIAEGAKKNCPISKTLAAVPTINLQATLSN